MSVSSENFESTEVTKIDSNSLLTNFVSDLWNPNSLVNKDYSETDRQPTQAIAEVIRAANYTPQDISNLVNAGKRFYNEGRIAESVKAFTEAALAGDTKSQVQLGEFYERGEGVPQDYSQALDWYSTAADNGNPEAMKNLGHLYESGLGVEEDWVTAAQWYKEGALAGNGAAAAALSRAFQFGIGVQQNRQEAINWANRAAQMGYEDAAYWSQKLARPLSNIGFRNNEERDLVIGGGMRTSPILLGGDPEGIMFRNSKERNAWLQGQRDEIDTDEAKQAGRSAASGRSWLTPFERREQELIK